MAMLTAKGCPNPEQIMAAYDNLANLDNNMELTQTPMDDPNEQQEQPAPPQDPPVMPTPPEQLTAVGQPPEDPNNQPVPPEEEEFYKSHVARMAAYEGQQPGESDADYFTRIEQEEAAAHNAEIAAEGAQDHTHMYDQAAQEMARTQGPHHLDDLDRQREHHNEYLDDQYPQRHFDYDEPRHSFVPNNILEEEHLAAYGGDHGHQGFEDGSGEPVGYPEWQQDAGDMLQDQNRDEEDEAYANPEAYLQQQGWTQMPMNQYHHDAPGPLPATPLWIDPNGPDEGYSGTFDDAHDAVDHLMQMKRHVGHKTADFPDDNLDEGVTDHKAKGNYPEDSHKNAPDHSAEGHHLPDKVNEIYNAIMREHPEYGKEKAMSIAWDRSGETKEKPKKKDSKVTVGMDGTFNGVTGKVIARHSDVWGQELARFSTEGGVFDVPFDQVTPAEPVAPISPADEIETYLSEIDQAGSDPASITARIENLTEVINVTHNLVTANKVSLKEQIRLDAINLNCKLEVGKLSKMKKQAELDQGAAYLETQPQYEFGAGVAGNDAYQGEGGWIDGAYNDMQDEASGIDQATFLPEQADLLTAELPSEVLGDQPAVQNIAEQNIEGFASTTPDPAAVVSKFVALVEASRRNRFAALKQSMAKAASAQPEVTGPDEAMFM
jgi:hypothetical protein